VPAGATAGLPGAAATAGVVVALDQGTKQLVVSEIARGDHVSVFPGLELTNARNTGVAFGALEGGGLVVAILIGLSLALLVGYFAVHRDMPWLWLPVGLLLGGALGNLADRARQGAVIDFIDPVAWPAFNVADSCIVVGVFLLLYVVEGRERLARREAS
jgi:signal peptidase II